MGVHLTALLQRSRDGLSAKVTTLPCLGESSIRGTTPALSLTVAGNKSSHSYLLLCFWFGTLQDTTPCNQSLNDALRHSRLYTAQFSLLWILWQSLGKLLVILSLWRVATGVHRWRLGRCQILPWVTVWFPTTKNYLTPNVSSARANFPKTQFW